MAKGIGDGLVTTALLVLTAAGVLLLGGCAPFSQAPQEPDLAFKIAMEVNSEQVFHASLGVQNEGQVPFQGDNSFNGTMEVRHMPGGDLRASAHMVPLEPMEPGETVWPLTWRGDLAGGTYELTWGAEAYGSTTEEFAIEEKDGRLYFRGQILATPKPTEIASEETDALVGEAVLDLANRIGAEREDVTVVTVEPFEFPDASLGVPEPGRSYAQVLTPGYVIRLRVGDELYEYHGAGERVVLVPRDGEGSDEGRLGLGLYASAPGADDLAKVVAAFDHMLKTAELVEPEIDLLPTPDEDAMRDWQVVEDTTYGFDVKIPADWTHKGMATDGPGVPGDWPLERSIALFPQAWAERFEERDGPPDPGAPPAVPAMTLEVYEGSLEQFRRAFPKPTREEAVEVNGFIAVRAVDVLGDDVEVVRYVFRSSENEDVRVVVADYYGGFPERREAHPEVADLNRLVAATFAWSR